MHTTMELMKPLMIWLSLQHLQYSAGELWQWVCGCSTQAWWFEVWVESRFKTSNRLLIKALFFKSEIVCIFNSVLAVMLGDLTSTQPHFVFTWCITHYLFDAANPSETSQTEWYDDMYANNSSELQAEGEYIFYCTFTVRLSLMFLKDTTCSYKNSELKTQ